MKTPNIVALHEAAHATIALALGVVVSRVSVAADDSHVTTRSPRNVPPDEHMAQLKKLIIIDLAGALAERRIGNVASDERNAFGRALRFVLGQYDLGRAAT